MRVFDDVRTRLVCIKAEFSLGEGDPMAIVSSGVPARVAWWLRFIHSPSTAPIYLNESIEV